MKQKIADLINVIFGFRKFLILLLVCAIAVVFRIKNLINGDELVRLLEPTTIAFFGANGVEHIVSVIKDHYAAAAADSENVVDGDAEADDLKAEEAQKG